VLTAIFVRSALSTVEVTPVTCVLPLKSCALDCSGLISSENLISIRVNPAATVAPSAGVENATFAWAIATPGTLTSTGSTSANSAAATTHRVLK
jgi:hypothetical protein